ncbi:MAG TPA: hypothetical protein DD727_07650 [Clostridiales bacterium]|nr:hypothetical protein [Clostridiales bacterium]
MPGIRILHCADFHFEAAFSGLVPSLAGQRREDLRTTFLNLVRWNAGTSEATEILLIAGDLFDGRRIGPATQDCILKGFASNPQTLVFIAPGNHDPIELRSLYRRLVFPDHVFVFGLSPAPAGTPVLRGRGILGPAQGPIRSVFLPEFKTCVYGGAFEGPYADEPFPGPSFRVLDPNCTNLMVLHADIDGIRLPGAYNPVSSASLWQSGIDYLALGHRHSHDGFKHAGETLYAYSGVPEGHGFDEPGTCGFIAGSVWKGGQDLAFVPAGLGRYERVSLDITGLGNHEDLYRRITEAVPASPWVFYQVVLRGLIAPGFQIIPDLVAEKACRDYSHLQVIDDTVTRPDPSGPAGSLRNLFIRELLDRIAAADGEEQKEILETALKAGLEAFGQRGGRG